jgi:hypothetical protein
MVTMQIVVQASFPDPIPTNTSTAERKTLERYVSMYGAAMRNSTSQILRDGRGNGLYSPSCMMHAIPRSTIQGQHWIPVVSDWFFGRGKLKQFYQMVESCPSTADGLHLPCNTYAAPGGGKFNPHGGCGKGGMRQCCQLSPKPAPPGPPPPPGPPHGSFGCRDQLQKDGCLAPTLEATDAATAANKCEQCASSHQSDLKEAGCTEDKVVFWCTKVDAR